MPSPSEAERQDLLRFARKVVVEAVTLGRFPDHLPNKEILAERRGVFVSAVGQTTAATEQFERRRL